MKRGCVYLAEVAGSLVVVGGLFWAAFFVTPTVKVETIERFPFERRDAFYSVVALDAEGRSICAVGSYGKIVRTDDAGETWSIQTTPTQAHLQKVVAWDTKSLLAVGDKNTVLVTRDAGEKWDRIQIPAIAGGEQLLSAFIHPDSQQAWVVGSMGTVLLSEDKGESWNRVHPEEDVSWNDVTVTQEQTLWVVGEFGNVQRSRDQGQSWQRIAVPTEASLNAIAFSDAAQGVIVGLSGTILVTADGGETWQAVDSGVQTHLYALLWDGLSYRTVGDDGRILTADASALAWEVAKLAPQNFGWYTGIARAGNAYIVSGAGVGVYQDGTWKPFTPGRADYKSKKGEGHNG